MPRLGATILSYYHTTSTVTAPDTNPFPTTTNLLPTQPPTGNEFQAWLSEFLGNGVFASDGAVWKHHRKIASNMFSRRLLRHTLAVGYDVGLDMIQRLKTLVRTGQPSDPDATFDGTTTVDVQDLFFRFTIDIFTLVAFGVELRSFQRDDQHPFAKAFDQMQTRIIERVPNPCWRLSRCLGCSAVERDIQRNAAIIDTFANEVIAQKRRAATNGTTTTGGTTGGTTGTTDGTEELGPDLISRFLTNNAKQHLKDDGTPPMTNTELRDIVLNFMIAGRDTTACALTWCMYVVLCRGLLSGFVVGVCCPRRVLPLTRCFFVLVVVVVVVVVVLVLVFLVLSVFSVLSVCLSLFVSTCFYLVLLVSTCFYLFLLVSICLHLSLYTLSASVCLGLPLPRYELAKNPKYGELIRAETVREGILATKQGEDPHDEQVAKQRYVSGSATVTDNRFIPLISLDVLLLP